MSYCSDKYGSISILKMLEMIETRDDQIERLVTFASILGLDLRDGKCADCSNDAWRSLPIGMQDAIDAESQRLEAERSEDNE